MKQYIRTNPIKTETACQLKLLKVSKLDASRAVIKPGADEKLILRAIKKYPRLLQELVSTSVISHPEWRPFFVLQLNHAYVLFKGRDPVFRSISMHVVVSELIERFHFRQKET